MARDSNDCRHDEITPEQVVLIYSAPQARDFFAPLLLLSNTTVTTVASIVLCICADRCSIHFNSPHYAHPKAKMQVALTHHAHRAVLARPH